MPLVNMTGEANGSTSTQLSWTDVLGIGGYNVLRNTASSLPGTPYTFLAGSPLPQGVEIFNDHTVSPATDYWYWLVGTDLTTILTDAVKITTNAAAVASPTYRALQIAIQKIGRASCRERV